ncbi:uncharacterized protein EHS24_001682 [Apiotrichum porosum]|uniref:Peptidase A1 domain-containing protein n=1 Tax=Apiotrichum porosum TaxID=105984 RepID=A0A427XIQ1_9TREE|nr:uncharacterized protein EHS24_001682 [Apiotrichum porosum]RSH78775.1 hypothetical protein EHS24_001682 [Apiotrichum porosum]
MLFRVRAAAVAVMTLATFVAGFAAPGASLSVPLLPHRSVNVRQQAQAPHNATMQYIGFSNKFAVNVSVGTPPQLIGLTLDTSFDYTVLFWGTFQGSDLQGYDDNLFFMPQNSSTYKSQRNVTLPNLEGLNWTVSTDVLSLGGYTVESQGFVLLDSTFSTDNQTYLQDLTIDYAAQMSGLLALGSGNDTALAPSFMKTVSTQWAEPVLGIYFGNLEPYIYTSNWDFTGRHVGELTFGGTNNSYYQGNFSWAPSSGNFDVELQGLVVNGHNISLPASTTPTSGGFTPAGPTIASINPGEDAFRVPAATAAEIFAQIPGSVQYLKGPTYGVPDRYNGRYLVPCNSSTAVTITIAGLSQVLEDSATVTAADGWDTPTGSTQAPQVTGSTSASTAAPTVTTKAAGDAAHKAESSLTMVVLAVSLLSLVM